MIKPASRSDHSPYFAAEGLSKSFGATRVLDGVGFEVPERSVVSFVGENGAGKSTLFNILSGVVQPDAGSMTLAGRPYRPSHYGDAIVNGVSRVFQEQALVPNIPVYENLLLGQDRNFYRAGQFVDRGAMVKAAQRIVDDADIDVDVRRRTGSYDFSRRQSIEIARACLAPSVLGDVIHPLVLLDEPTSALDQRDEEAFFRLVAKMRRRGSLIFVSHRLSEVLAISDLIYVLKDGALVARLEASQADEQTLHSLMVGRERVADYYYERRQKVIGDAPAVVDVASLSRPDAYEDISLSIRAGEILGVGGLLDSGKSRLGKGIAGVEPPADGTVSLKGQPPVRPDIRAFIRAGLGYVPAERLAEGIITSQSLSWNFSLASGDLFSSRLGLWRRQAEVQATSGYIRSLGIRSGTPTQPLDRLSGGNQQKVVLARWLQRKPDVLVLDNPTRGVDAGAKEEIYRIIRDLTDRGVAILLITDELLELIGLSNRILILQRGRIAAEFDAPVDGKPSERELVASMLPQSGPAGREQALPSDHLSPSLESAHP